MLKFSKTREVKSIERGTKGSAGLDFFVPVATIDFLSDFKEKNRDVWTSTNSKGIVEFVISGHESVVIPSGIKVKIPEGKVLIGFNKSGIGVKLGLVFKACVIDSDYQGEIFINLLNTKNEPVKFEEGQKIAQFLLLDAWHGTPEEVPVEKLYEKVSERGDGCLGSTNLNEVIYGC